MISFHGQQEIKDKYVNRVIKHRELDNITKGIGWENWKGCAVGCTLENYDHYRYPVELGLPKWLALLEDVIFENLPNDEAMKRPELFLTSIPIGVDVENIKHTLSIKRLSRLKEIQLNLIKNNENFKKIIEDIIISIDLIIKCHESELNKTYCDWSAARSAAESAAEARSSAWKKEADDLIELLKQCK